MADTKALVPLYGSNRSLRAAVGEALAGCRFVAIPFAGSCTEVETIDARSILLNDKHRHLINLARVARNHCDELVRVLDPQLFDPDTLSEAQEVCRDRTRAASPGLFRPSPFGELDHRERLSWAAAYFYASWCGRNGVAGSKGELHGGLCYRYDGGGGDPVVRYRSAVAALPRLAEAFGRCAFAVGDGLALIEKLIDGRRKSSSNEQIGIYCDPPFPGPGDQYIYPMGDAEQRELATLLATAPPSKVRVICRYYDHPLIQELYPADRWTWRHLTGGKDQHNTAAPEVLLSNQQEPDRA